MINSLNVAQTGLAASKASVENVMNNVANINTEGYKKRVVETSELAHSDSRIYGRGVSLDNASRTTSQYLYDNIIKETSKENYYNELSGMLGNVESIFKETAEGGFSKDIDRYFQTVENLRANPNNEVYKNELKLQGQMLVEDLQRLYQGLEDQESLAKSSLEEDVTSVNTILKEIGEVNKQIGQQSNATNDLLDRRDLLEKQLSEFVDVNVDRSNNEYALKIGGEVAVRNSSYRQLTVNETFSPQQDRYADTTTGLDNIASKFATFGTGDSITFEVDNTNSITVSYGESFTDAQGNTQTVDDTNMIQALVSKINNDSDLAGKVKAYNGNYSLDTDGNKVEYTGTTDQFLLIESKLDGEDHKFDSRITINDTNGSGTALTNTVLFKTETQSKDAVDSIAVQLFDEDLNITNGRLKASLANLQTDSGANKFNDYKKELDTFAKTFVDITASYIKVSDNNYIHGEIATDESLTDAVDINLFTGSSVETMVFNATTVDTLEQKHYDYLSTHQWKKDISFTGFGQSATVVAADDGTRSFSEFYQNVRTEISRDKENTDFLKDTQRAVNESLNNSYDQVVKVDNDEEMIQLIKFQAAYTANAKIVTIVDEMLQTLLGMKR